MTADQIAAALARTTFADSLVVVDRCTWTGNEADLLVVTRNLRVVDVEVKISRADLKADRRKDKWWDRSAPCVWSPAAPVPREWPRRTWKHYYAMPAELWREDLIDACGRVSGILLLHNSRRVVGTIAGVKEPGLRVQVRRAAKPDRTAQPISAADAIAIARLASLRMWDAYAARDSAEVAAKQRTADAAEAAP